MTDDGIKKANEQYAKLASSRNRMEYYLSTTDDGVTWTFRMQSPEIAKLRERGEEWVRIRTCKDWQITPHKIGFQ